MPSELVRRIRNRYPDAYTDLTDEQLEATVLKKYPEYQDLAKDDFPPPPQPQKGEGQIPMPGTLATGILAGAKGAAQTGRRVLGRAARSGFGHALVGGAGATAGGRLGSRIGVPFGGATMGAYLGHRIGGLIGAESEGSAIGGAAGATAGEAVRQALTRRPPPLERLITPASEAAAEAQRLNLAKRAAHLRGLQSAAGQPISKVPSFTAEAAEQITATPIKSLKPLGPIGRLGRILGLTGIKRAAGPLGFLIDQSGDIGVHTGETPEERQARFLAEYLQMTGGR